MTTKLSKHVETGWAWPASVVITVLAALAMIAVHLSDGRSSSTIVVEHVWTEEENAALDDARATCLAAPELPACATLLLPPNGPQPLVGLIWYLSSDPTAGAGMAAPLYQLLVRTDVPSIYYKSGSSNTAWTLIGTSTGGGGGGTVTSVACGTGMSCSPSPITTSGTVSIANTAVTPATYTNATVTVNQQGQITSASSGTAPVTGTGTSPDLTVWTGASTVGSYGGSAPSGCGAGSATTAVALSAAGVLTQTCATINAINANSAVFGNGIDGPAAFTGTGGTVAGATLSGSTYTMQRNIYCSGCTVSTGVTIKENGFSFQDNGTLTLTGTANINDNGASAVTTTAGATRGAQWFGGTAAGGGTAAPGGASASALCNPFLSTTSGGAAGAIASTGGNGGTCVGGGGGGASATNTGDAGGALTAEGVAGCGNLEGALRQGRVTFNLGTSLTQGTGGGGGGTNGGAGGAGGAAGGEAFVAARKLAGTGTITANGGNGGTAGGAGGGGGGGGGAGYAVVIYETDSGSVTLGATGGNGGPGNGGGNGGNGGNCLTFAFNLSGDGT